MAVLNENTLNEIINYLEKSITNLSKGAFASSEFQGDFQGLENFLSNQFDIRLENLLQAKSSSIHHLESGMKNKVIQKKKELLESIKNQSHS